MRHIHVHLRDASEAQVTWKQFLRKLETGEWQYNGTPTPGQATYYVTQGTKKKGVHNFVGRTVMVSIMMTSEEAKAAKEEEDAKQIAYYRSLRELQKKNTPKDALTAKEAAGIKKRALADIEYWEKREGDPLLSPAKRAEALENRLSAQRTLMLAVAAETKDGGKTCPESGRSYLRGQSTLRSDYGEEATQGSTVKCITCGKPIQLRAGISAPMTYVVVPVHNRATDMAIRKKEDPDGIIHAGRWYKRIVRVTSLGPGKYEIVTRQHGTFKLDGGKHGGGARTDWFLTGGWIGEQAMAVRGLVDALDLLEGA